MKRRYMVFLGNGEIIKCYRTISDWLWFDNPFSGFVRFRLDGKNILIDGTILEAGSVMKVSKHFTIRVVEIK